MTWPSESVCGDSYVVTEVPHGAVVAVFDGLGHGHDAALAAERAAETVRRFGSEPIVPLVHRCHNALIGTRGVVMSLAAFDAPKGSMSWIGIGNVEGVLLRADRRAAPAHEHLVQRGGLVGHSLPPLRPSMRTVAAGDVLILATDGVNPDFLAEFDAKAPAKRIAEKILNKCATRRDDALVFVMRYGTESGPE